MAACSLDDCSREVQARELCTAHYTRLRRYGTPTGGGPMRRWQQPVCAAEGCDTLTRGGAYDYCPTHYRRLRAGDVRAHDPIREMGVGHITKQGYRNLYKPGHPNAGKHGHLLEHRFVMSEMLGRPLRENETVHHRNGRRDDNRPENLELWVTRHHLRGSRVEDVITEAVEALRLYAPGLLVVD